jgi:hypothetical protein
VKVSKLNAILNRLNKTKEEKQVNLQGKSISSTLLARSASASGSLELLEEDDEDKRSPDAWWWWWCSDLR